MKLKFPLDHYDEQGRLKPPLFLYVILLFICRPVLLLIIALTMGDKSDWFMSIYYPSNTNFYLALVPMLPAFLALMLLSQRESNWKKEKFTRYRWLFPLIGAALFLDIALQLIAFNEIGWQFSLAKGLMLLFSFLSVGYLKRSRHVETIHDDWRKPD